MATKTLNREKYKQIKRMDHKQMEAFIYNIYKGGYEDGVKAVVGIGIKPDDIAAAITDIKGIGTKKTAEIMAAINQLYEGKK